MYASAVSKFDTGEEVTLILTCLLAFLTIDPDTGILSLDSNDASDEDGSPYTITV